MQTSGLPAQRWAARSRPAVGALGPLAGPPAGTWAWPRVKAE